jgi:dihydroorotase
MNLVIKNGRVIEPSSYTDRVADIWVKDGKIQAIGPNLSATGATTGVRTIDATNRIVTAGWIDMHTHLREPGAMHKETIRTGSEAAARGGFTSIACMANTNPVNDSSFVTSYIYQKVSSEALINVYAIGAITKGLKGEELAEIGLMYESGIVGISDDGRTVMNSYLLRKAMDYSKRFDLVVISHAEDANLKGKGVMNEGFNSARFGLRGIPRASEDIIVARDILLAELTGCRLHIAHVSTAGSVQLIREAKRRGVRVTAEVTPHHLVLTDEAVGNYDTNTKVAPPLRESHDVNALRDALAEGTIDSVASDHAPHSLEEKEVEYDLAEFGMVGLETAFPIYYDLVRAGEVPLYRLIESMTTKPAEILSIPKGKLGVGADADITIFDPLASYVIDKERFRSKSKNTPFHGRKVTARVTHTIVAGRVVYEMGETV